MHRKDISCVSAADEYSDAANVEEYDNENLLEHISLDLAGNDGRSCDTPSAVRSRLCVLPWHVHQPHGERIAG